MTYSNPDSGDMRRTVLTALTSPDAVWYRNMLRKNILACPLSDEEECNVVSGATKAAADMARWIMSNYNAMSASEIAKALGLDIRYSSEEINMGKIYLGLYHPDTKTIVLNQSTISLVRQVINEHGLADLTKPDDVMRITIFHEIFHALEDETPAIFTRSRMLKRKLLGVFPYSRGVSGASEVGAVHFSKCMADVSYSPCIFEQYLLLALGQLSIDFLPPKM